MNRSVAIAVFVALIGLGIMYFVHQNRALSTILETSRISLEDINGEGHNGSVVVIEETVEGIPPLADRYGPVPQYPEGSFGAYLDSLDRRMTSLQLQAHMENLEGETMDWEGRVSHVSESLSQLSVVIEHPADEPDSIIGLSRKALLFFSRSHKEELLNLNKGDIIKVRCQFQEMWYGGAHMKDCELL